MKTNNKNNNNKNDDNNNNNFAIELNSNIATFIMLILLTGVTMLSKRCSYVSYSGCRCGLIPL